MSAKPKPRMSLEMPAAVGDPQTDRRVLNEKLRRIQSELEGTASTGTAAATVATASSSAAGQEIVLSVPGTLAIRSNAAALVSLPAARNVSEIVAVVKQAAAGGDLNLALFADGAAWATLKIAAGGKTATAAAKSLALAKNALVTLDITGVGLTFPGADLTVMIRLA